MVLFGWQLKAYLIMYADPVIGITVMFVALLGLFGGYMFPVKSLLLLVAIVGGVIYALLLGALILISLMSVFIFLIR